MPTINKENPFTFKQNIFLVLVGSRWENELASAPVDCGKAHAVQKLEFQSNGIHATCSTVAGLGPCTPNMSPQVDVKNIGIGALAQLPVVCQGAGEVIQKMTFEYSEGGGWARWRYDCCGVGGAPVAVEPINVQRSLFSAYEGVYCPTKMDAKGVFEYIRTVALPMAAKSSTLKFDWHKQEWCIRETGLADRCVYYANANPLGLGGSGASSTSSWEMVDVSNFDGKFEGQGAGLPKKGTSPEIKPKIRNQINLIFDVFLSQISLKVQISLSKISLRSKFDH